ncbi:MAG: hypothetical protein AVDCRST_MAG02-3697, partial [uncultured Rubrobacteraceae bacterium]
DRPGGQTGGGTGLRMDRAPRASPRARGGGGRRGSVVGRGGPGSGAGARGGLRRGEL